MHRRFPRIPAVLGVLAVLALALAAGALGRVSEASHTVTLGPDDPVTHAAKCRQGADLTGVGFFAPLPSETSGFVITNTLQPITDPKVLSEAEVVSGSSSVDHTVFGYCVKGVKTRRVTETAPYASEEVFSVTAECPAGKRVIGGGFAAPAVSTSEAAVIGSRRTSKAAWTASIWAGSPQTGAGLTAVAICAKGIDLTQVTGRAEAAGLEGGVATARCPKGEAVISGGFDPRLDDGPHDSTVPLPLSMQRHGKRVWTASAIGNESAVSKFAAVAYCAKL